MGNGNPEIVTTESDKDGQHTLARGPILQRQHTHTHTQTQTLRDVETWGKATLRNLPCENDEDEQQRLAQVQYLSKKKT